MVRWSSASSIEPSMAGRRSVRWRAERCTARQEKHGATDIFLPLPPRRIDERARVSAPLLLVPLHGRRARTRSAQRHCEEATVCELLSPSGSTTEFSQSCAQMRPPFFVVPPPRPPTLIGSSSTSLSSYLLQTQNVRSASPWAGPSLHATEGAVEVRRARRRLEDTVTDERVGLFTPDKDGDTADGAGCVPVIAARRGTVCGEVGRVLRFPQLTVRSLYIRLYPLRFPRPALSAGLSWQVTRRLSVPLWTSSSRRLHVTLSLVDHVTPRPQKRHRTAIQSFRQCCPVSNPAKPNRGPESLIGSPPASQARPS